VVIELCGLEVESEELAAGWAHESGEHANDSQAGKTEAKPFCGSEFQLPAGTHALPL